MVTLNPRLTGALAWLGLAVVVAVPSADFLSGGRAATIRPEAGPAPAQAPAIVVPARSGIAELPPLPAGTTAAATVPIGPRVAPARPSSPQIDRIETASTAPADPVESYLSAGKPLPGYIRDPAPAAAAPAHSETAALARDQPIPYPMPRSMRPSIADFPAPARPAAPLVIEEPPVREARAQPRFPVPQVPVGPAPFPPAYPDGEVVTSEQLEQWDSGSLADYLERRRLLGPEAPSGPSRMRPAPPPSWGAGYPAAPPSGFWLSDSPYALGGGGYAY